MIELLCLDVDGTLSDGKLHYTFQSSSYIETFKSFNVKDGLGLAYWHKIGKKSAIITGRKNPVLEQRARELNIDFVFMDIRDKGQCVRTLKKDLNLNTESCAAIGDDMNDIAMFKEVGMSFAPFDCADEIKNKVTINLNKSGGNGAVREAIEYILKKEDLYEEFVKYWE